MATEVSLMFDGRVVRASYSGGAYVELTFGSLPQATEVINVWDDEAGKPEITESISDLATTVEKWVASQDEEWPEWYDGYLENGRWR